jgi:4-aminobutyrate aminotransferase-like enzyme
VIDLGHSDALVGIGNRRVAYAVHAQLMQPDPRLLSQYADALLALVVEPLRVCTLLHSLTEATELTLRIARLHRPGKDVIVHADTVHGMSTSLVNMSPGRRKFWVQTASRTDAADIATKADVIHSSGRGLCAFFAQGIFESDYLRDAYASVRAAGGLNIAIEAQTGMRLAASTFEFQRHQVVPDLLVLGPSIANGFPLAAVITTEEFAPSFALEIVSPAACAAGLAVIEQRPTGICEPDFGGLKARGSGLCWEIDVADAAQLVARLADLGFTIPARGNTLLFRPPLNLAPEVIANFVKALHTCAS